MALDRNNRVPAYQIRELDVLKEVAKIIDSRFAHLRLCTITPTDKGINIRWALIDSMYWFHTEISYSDMKKYKREEFIEAEYNRIRYILMDWITERKD